MPGRVVRRCVTTVCYDGVLRRKTQKNGQDKNTSLCSLSSHKHETLKQKHDIFSPGGMGGTLMLFFYCLFSYIFIYLQMHLIIHFLSSSNFLYIHTQSSTIASDSLFAHFDSITFLGNFFLNQISILLCDFLKIIPLKQTTNTDQLTHRIGILYDKLVITNYTM